MSRNGVYAVGAKDDILAIAQAWKRRPGNVRIFTTAAREWFVEWRPPGSAWPSGVTALP